jgi:hypothetical protein
MRTKIEQIDLLSSRVSSTPEGFVLEPHERGGYCGGGQGTPGNRGREPQKTQRGAERAVTL